MGSWRQNRKTFLGMQHVAQSTKHGSSRGVDSRSGRQNFFFCYGTQRFIAVFTRAVYWTALLVIRIQKSNLHSHILSLYKPFYLLPFLQKRYTNFSPPNVPCTSPQHPTPLFNHPTNNWYSNPGRWSPSTFMYNGYRVFTGGKATETWCWPSTFF
jgi:hypothetical protein